jgi:hypothetical protein
MLHAWISAIVVLLVTIGWCQVQPPGGGAWELVFTTRAVTDTVIVVEPIFGERWEKVAYTRNTTDVTVYRLVGANGFVGQSEITIDNELPTLEGGDQRSAFWHQSEDRTPPTWWLKE